MKYSNDPSIQLNTMKEYISRSKDLLVIAQREKEIVEAREDARLAEEECHKSNTALSEAQAQQVLAQLPEKWTGFVASSATLSPAHTALNAHFEMK